MGQVSGVCVCLCVCGGMCVSGLLVMCIADCTLLCDSLYNPHISMPTTHTLTPTLLSYAHPRTHTVSLPTVWSELQRAKVDMKAKFGVPCDSLEELTKLIRPVSHTHTRTRMYI